MRTSTPTTDELRYRHPTFPWGGAQYEKLFNFRTVIERGHSLMRTVGRFGGDAEARVPIRGLDNLRFRPALVIITLNLLAIVNARLELPAHLGSDWGTGPNLFDFPEEEAA